MGGLEAASLIVKLKYLQGWNRRRQEIARRYQHEIDNTRISMQVQPTWANSVYHLFVITTDDQKRLQSFLNQKNIFPGLHYPVSCHLQKAYRHLEYHKGDFPNAEYLASHCLSLPIYAELTDDEVGYIISVLNQY
jgi:dTDP-4-amino-4,6-dideoxygalactose transaminase